METDFKNITTRIRKFICGKDGDFNELARDLFTLQYEQVEPYRNLCKSRGVMPSNVKLIPTIPTTSFKEFDISSLPDDDRPTVFKSSGTTEQTSSRHFHNADSLKLYEESLINCFEHHLQPTPNTLALTPSPEEAPHSSLTHMLQYVQRNPTFTGEIKNGTWVVNINNTLKMMSDLDAPVTLMGTAFSFIHLCDAIKPIQLPIGSHVMETGGYKGRSRELSKTEFHLLISKTFGVPRENIACEYGMCELSSQAYATKETAGLFQFPHWARARIVSPENDREVSFGEAGLLEIIDLSNVRSVLAVRTADLAVHHEDGFELLGRAALAEPRGCSLASA